MPINSVGDLANSWVSNKVFRSYFHKTSTPILSGNGFWMDSSMSAGTPKYNPYVGNALEFTPLIGSGNNGINAGLGGTSYIVRYNLGGGTFISAAFPASVLLLDYIGFYPLVDMDNTDEQVLDNVNYATRYTGGLRAIAVTTIPQTSASPVEVIMTYTGSNNVQTATRFFVGPMPNAGNINILTNGASFANTFTAPFIPLGVGTTDVKRIDKIQVTGNAGGFCAFVLVKPILEATVYDNITPYEIEFPRNKVPPAIPSGAYLNHIACPISGGTQSNIARGHIVFARE